MPAAGKLALSVLSLLVAGLAPAWPADDDPPPPPLESVTVTATKVSQAAIDNFIITHAAPAGYSDKLARWRLGICPLTVGLDPKFTQYVSQRVRNVAASVGAPVNTDAACKPNIRIVFTTKPQEFLDGIRKDSPSLLGYYDSPAVLARLVAFTHPIQSWYVTATRDVRGQIDVDNAKGGGVDRQVRSSDPLMPPSLIERIDMPYARTRNVSGFRIDDGLSSEFSHVLIVAEPAKLLNFEIGALSDYIAMLALAQPGALDACTELPSITNLLSSGCSGATNTITDGDLAYLRGLYRMTPGGNLHVQRGEVRYQMEQALKPKDN